MTSRFNFLSRFRKDRSGQFGIICALTITPMIGLIGFSYDYGRANDARQQLQAATDVAALAAVRVPKASDAERIRRARIAFNAYLSRVKTQLSPDSPTLIAGNGRVLVKASGTVDTVFMRFARVNELELSVQSETEFGQTGGDTSFGTTCLLSLQTTDDGLFMNGEAAIKGNCGIHVNSQTADAVHMNHDTSVEVPHVCIVGGLESEEEAHFSTAPFTGCPSMQDPLENLAVPAEADDACTFNNKNVKKASNDSWVTIGPGVYCGGLSISSNAKVIMTAGTYIIRDGQFRIQSGATVTGNGVFFHLTGNNARFDFTSGSLVTFKAPSTGYYKGILIFSARTARTPQHQFGSHSNSYLQGVVYSPATEVHITCSGEVGAEADWTMWVVKRLEMKSHSVLRITSSYATSETPRPDAMVNAMASQVPVEYKIILRN